MSTGLPKTNYYLLEIEYDKEITEIRKGANGLPSEPGAIRKTVIFSDSTKLSCQEFIKDGFIDFYNYDYYDANGNIVMKFHSEPHVQEEARTETEPFHLHVRTDIHDLKASKRIPFPSEPFKQKDLLSFIECILMSRYLWYAHAPTSSIPTSEKEKRERRKRK